MDEHKQMTFLVRAMTCFPKPLCLLLLGCLLTATHCRKYDTVPCRGGGYAFLATAEWSPQRETYRVGDTLYLTSTIPKILIDQINTSMVIDYSNSVGISGDLSISLLDSVSRRPLPARDSFGLVALTGRFAERPLNQKGGINFYYDEAAQHYRFQAGLVCKKKGAYLIYVFSVGSRGLRGRNCTNAGFSMTVTNTEKHEHLWQNSLQMTPDYVQKKHMYCFIVN